MAHLTKSDKTLQASKARPLSVAQEQRQARLAAELRANLQKRKQQARGRAVRNAGDSAAETGTAEAAETHPGQIGKASDGQSGEVA